MVLLLPLIVASDSSVPFTAFGGVHHTAPAAALHHAVHAAPVISHHTVPVIPHHVAPSYGYERTRYNCSVVDTVEKAQVCRPKLASNINTVNVNAVGITSKEQCHSVSRTVCAVSIQLIPNQVCTYSYQQKEVETTGKTVEVSFSSACHNQVKTVCQPSSGYGQHGYGHNYCHDVSRETCYTTPKLTTVQPPLTVSLPEPVKTCTIEHIRLPRIKCEEMSEEKCITVPESEDRPVQWEKAVTGLGDATCSSAVALTLPKQACIENVYGYSH